MDHNLKALKVVDLKAILAKANLSFPAKATKADLISKISASEKALAVYAEIHPPDDLLAPPEDVDWNTEQEQKTEVVVNPPTPAAETPAVPPTPAAPVAAGDLEEEKRRKRAERFGIPVVQPRPAPASKASKAAKPPADKLDARAARFGTAQKRAAPAENVDADEAERRKKRAERFGTGPIDTKA